MSRVRPLSLVPASIGVLVLILGVLGLSSCGSHVLEPGTVKDEAMSVGRDAASFPAADEDYFHDMDGGVPLSKDEVKGRNTWIVWTAGNDRLWDVISRDSFGGLDFLKTLSSYPGLKANRDNRWDYLGLVNDPCFEKGDGPTKDRFGLWLDKRRPACGPDPFENAAKYPGVAIGARGKTQEVGSFYGYATGIVGLRLFPNPDFDESAAKAWDAERYYKDPSYYERKDLIKPYRVGMSCGFCHVGPNPNKPPTDPNNPEWSNLSSNVGAQYFWVDRIFYWSADPSSFPFQLFHTSRPGALDTSLISSDNINNPRTMNAIYSLMPRLVNGERLGKETLAGGALNNRQFNDFVSTGPLTELFQQPATVFTPHVLKDGADSVGALGALNRVYLNIGLFSEEWLLHFRPLIGGKRITPIAIADARKNSSYWRATEQQTLDMARFFLATAKPNKLAEAPGGKAAMTQDAAVLARGKDVFAETCARCHSSKLPDLPQNADVAGCAGPRYLDCFNRYWAYTKTPAFKDAMKAIVRNADFLDNNFLSSDIRVPVTLLQTNACSPLASNAIGGNIWDNFSSQSYKDLPSVGTITVHDPFTGEERPFQMPAGGRGYSRPASLVSVWSTAPFLLNNTVGRFDPDPSVPARLRAFDDAIGQMLWPERRDKDSVLGDKVPGVIDRTTAPSYLRVPVGYLPNHLKALGGFLDKWFPSVFSEDGVSIGPIPKGTPVNLLSNVALLSESNDPAERLLHDARVLELLITIKEDLKRLPANASDEDAKRVFGNLRERLLSFSKCPDFVVNRGHYFGTAMLKEEEPLADGDKKALIEFLKTF